MADAEGDLSVHDASRTVTRDGAALGGSAMITALAGLLGWLLAARLLPQAEIGNTAVFVNSFVLVASVSELGMGPAMLRWLPRAGHRALPLLVRCYAAAFVTSLVVASVWAVLFHGSLTAAITPFSFPMMLLCFVLASASWVLFHLEDEALTGLGWARFVPVENTIFAVVRIAALIWLAPRYGGLGIILSWMLPTVVLVVIVNALIATRTRRRTGSGALPTRREVWALVAPTYPAQVAVAATGSVTQVLITNRLGAEPGAAFFVVWMGLNALDLALTGFGNSLVVQLGQQEGPSGHLIRKTFGRVLLLLLPALAVAFILAPWLLTLFGSGYVMATAMLRWVLVGFLGRTVVILVCALHLATGRTLRMGLLQAGTAVSILVLASFAHSLTWFAIGYCVTQAVMAAIALADLARSYQRPQEVADVNG